MATKIDDLTAASALDGTAGLHAVCGFIGQNISEITLEVWDSVSGVGGLTSTLLSADGQLLFSGSYET